MLVSWNILSPGKQALSSWELVWRSSMGAQLLVYPCLKNSPPLSGWTSSSVEHCSFRGGTHGHFSVLSAVQLIDHNGWISLSGNVSWLLGLLDLCWVLVPSCLLNCFSLDSFLSSSPSNVGMLVAPFGSHVASLFKLTQLVTLSCS